MEAVITEMTPVGARCMRFPNFTSFRRAMESGHLPCAVEGGCNRAPMDELPGRLIARCTSEHRHILPYGFVCCRFFLTVGMGCVHTHVPTEDSRQVRPFPGCGPV